MSEEMNKPLLTKEQAKAMEAIKAKIDEGRTLTYASHTTAIRHKLKGESFFGERREASSISDDDFIAALYIGWEIEQTPEEKVREYYERVKPGSYHCELQPGDYKISAIKHTLNLLGIKIEGVNA
jgi:hypothetical protein